MVDNEGCWVPELRRRYWSLEFNVLGGLGFAGYV